MQPITFKSTEMQHARAFICAGARHRTAYYFLAGRVFCSPQDCYTTNFKQRAQTKNSKNMQPKTFDDTEVQHARAFICAGARPRAGSFACLKCRILAWAPGLVELSAHTYEVSYPRAPAQSSFF